MTVPPGNSLDADQNARVIDAGADLGDGLRSLLRRIGDEVDFNDAKGSTPYRLGMHDGLRFAEDAIAGLLTAHGHTAEARPRAGDA